LRWGAAIASCAFVVQIAVGMVNEVALDIPSERLIMNGPGSVWNWLGEVLLAIGGVMALVTALTAPRARILFGAIGVGLLVLSLDELVELHGRPPKIVLGLALGGLAAALLRGILRHFDAPVRRVMGVGLACLACVVLVDAATPKRLDDFGRTITPLRAVSVIEESLETLGWGYVAAALVSFGLAAVVRRDGAASA
jgi:hypothetical protein